MQRVTASLLLLLLCSFTRPAQAARPLDMSPAEIVGTTLFMSAIGAVHPPGSGKVLVGFGLMPDDADDELAPRFIDTTTFLVAGGYDIQAGERGASHGSVFAANLVVFGAGFSWMSYASHDHCCTSQHPVPRGFYLAPLTSERGALLGYHWTF